MEILSDFYSYPSVIGFGTMSDEELIGKFGVKYRDARQRMASLQAQARHYGNLLSGLGANLIELASGPAEYKLGEVPTWEQINNLLIELRAATDELNGAREELKNLGFPVE